MAFIISERQARTKKPDTKRKKLKIKKRERKYRNTLYFNKYKNIIIKNNQKNEVRICSAVYVPTKRTTTTRKRALGVG